MCSKSSSRDGPHRGHHLHASNRTITQVTVFPKVSLSHLTSTSPQIPGENCSLPCRYQTYAACRPTADTNMNRGSYQHNTTPTCEGSKVKGVHSQKDPVHREGRQHELQGRVHPAALPPALHEQVRDKRRCCREGHKHDGYDLGSQLVFVRDVRAPWLGERCRHLRCGSVRRGRGERRDWWGVT